MTFLNPAILWGLLGISIPILIHIFNLKRTKKIEFSTLMFLKEIQQSKYKRIKLKQLLILLCRIAFIIFLVLAFSRPFEKGYLFSSGSKARSSVLLVLDDSFSMLNREIQGSDFDAAKNRINETISLFNEDDEVYFTTISSINRNDKNFLFKNLDALRDSVKNSKVSDISRDFNSVLYFANRILETASNPNKEIFLFTDGQKTFFDSDISLPADVKLPDRTKLNIILTGARKGNNLTVDSIDIATKIYEKNKPVKIKCRVSNHNSFNVSNKSVVLSLGKKQEKEEKVIDIPANSSLDLEFSVIPGATGFISGNVELLEKEIADDEIPNDNKQYFTFYVPAKIKLLLITETSADLSYLKLALSSSEDLMKDSSGSKTNYYDIKQVSSNEIQSENLSFYNCIICVNEPAFSQAVSIKLKEYVQNGGGLIIYPGEKTQTDNYNSGLFKLMDIPNILSKYSSALGSQVYKFENIDLSHPIFDGIFIQNTGAKESLLKDSPEIQSGFDIVTGVNSQAIITLNGNKNFLIEYSRGKGKVLLFGVSPDQSGSNYASKTVFSPITVRSILYLSPIGTVKSGITGKDYFADLLSAIKSDTSQITISNASSNLIVNEFAAPQNNSFINLKYYVQSYGNYTLSQKGNVIYAFASNFDRKESFLDKLNQKEMMGLMKKRLNTEVNIISPESSISAIVTELRIGKELWQYLLVFALLMILAEFLIARTIKT